MSIRFEAVARGFDASDPRPGDFILCHRKGFLSAAIRAGERLRFSSGARWSHVAYCETPQYLIEALTTDVRRTPLRAYRHVEYVLVKTGLEGVDVDQATAFAQSCIGQRYGWPTIVGIALRFLTPGRGLWWGMNGTEICSGLVAQALVRGWANFPVNPASMTPAELAEVYYAPTRPVR